MHHSSSCSRLFRVAASVALFGCDVDASATAEQARLAQDLPMLSEAGECPPAALFGEGVLSTAQDEGRIVFSSDGNTAYFHRLSASGVLELQTSRKRGRSWTTPQTLPFSGEFDDLDPFVTPRHDRMLFASSRPLPDGSWNGDMNLWTVERSRGGWGTPRPLSSAVNSSASELFPSVTADGTLYFNSDREGGFGGWDIYRASRAGADWQEVENLGAQINTEAWEFNPAPTPDGEVLFFASMFRTEHEDADLYASVRLFNAWVPSWNLGACVNTRDPEYHPSLDPRGTGLFFVRSSATAGGDFHRIAFE